LAEAAHNRPKKRVKSISGLRSGFALLPRVDAFGATQLGRVAYVDAIIGVEVERKSAAHYQADFVVIPDAAHNLMMEHNYRETAETIHSWLNAHGVV
jgi:hypothetical protein